MYVARHHRHQTPPVIQDCLTTAIAEVRSDDFENDWVLAGFDGRDNIHLVGTGTGGIEVRVARWSGRLQCCSGEHDHMGITFRM